MYRYQVESLDSVRDELDPLIQEHWEEVGQFNQLDMDWDTYYKLEAAGALCIITCRYFGKLIGYASYIISRHLHYKTEVLADSDAFFLHHLYRKGFSALKFFKVIAEELKMRGVTKVLARSKPQKDLSCLMKRLGYRPLETVFVKDLG